MSWLPAFEQQLYDRLEKSTTKEEVLKVCEKIMEDDCGEIDLLASGLADSVLRVMGDKKDE